MELLDMAMIVYRTTLHEVGSTETAVMAVHYATEVNIRTYYYSSSVYLHSIVYNRALDSIRREKCPRDCFAFTKLHYVSLY